MEKTGLAPAPSRLVKPPRVAASPCALECKWVQTVSLTDYEGRPIDRHVVFGQVIGVYIDDAFLRDGLLDTGAMQPIMRAGYNDYYSTTPGPALFHAQAGGRWGDLGQPAAATKRVPRPWSAGGSMFALPTVVAAAPPRCLPVRTARSAGAR